MAPPSTPPSSTNGAHGSPQHQQYGITGQEHPLKQEGEAEAAMDVSSSYFSSADLSLSAAEVAELRRALRRATTTLRSGQTSTTPPDAASEAGLAPQRLPKKQRLLFSGTTDDLTPEATPPADAAAGAAEHGRYLVRATATYEDRGMRFRLPQRFYQQQYSSVYFTRLAAMSPLLMCRAQSRWPGVRILSCVKDLQIGRECVLIGTLYKEMPMKPSVLKEYLNDLNLQTQVNRFFSSADALFLEDQTARVRLELSASCLSSSRAPRGSSSRAARDKEEEEDEEEEEEMQNEEPKRQWQRLGLDGLVTGLLVAVRGRSGEGGSFEVADMCVAGGPPVPAPSLAQQQSSSSSHAESSGASPRYVAFVSGLRIGSARRGSPLHLQLLRDFLLGAFGSKKERELAAGVVRLVIAGDALAAAGTAGDAETRQSAATTATVTPTAAAAAAAAASLQAAFEEADVFLALLGSSIPVDLMPGAGDPSTFSLPQRCVHSALLPRCRRYASIASFTNPHAFAVDQTRFVGASGQPVKNICKFSGLDPLGALELCVEARCLAPTAPDTLSMYPFIGADPFCLTDQDDFFHVYFSANHEKLLYKYMCVDALSPLPVATPSTAKEAETAEEAAPPTATADAADAAAARGHAEVEEVQMEATSYSAAAVSPPAAAAVFPAAASSCSTAVRTRPSGPLLLCVPDFSKDPTIVLVDINSLAVVPIRFAVRSSKEEEE